ncbi:MAG: LuxR C-terminal-related transcriptional regulator [Terriglobales bacterium]
MTALAQQQGIYCINVTAKRKSTKPSAALRVCLVYSHPLVATEVSRLLHPPEFRTHSVELPAAPGSQLPDSAFQRHSAYIFDAHAPLMIVRGSILQVVEHCPAARVLVVADKLGEPTAFPLLHLGVKGLLLYSEMSQQLAKALHAVADGGYWVPRVLLSRFVDTILTAERSRPTLRASGLSSREREILNLLLENLSNKEIGARLSISERTVKFHVSNVLTKFGVGRRADLVLLWYQNRSALGITAGMM